MSGLPPATIRKRVKIFVGGLPVFCDDTEAILQLCRIFLLEGFDIGGVSLFSLYSQSVRADDMFTDI